MGWGRRSGRSERRAGMHWGPLNHLIGSRGMGPWGHGKGAWEGGGGVGGGVRVGGGGGAGAL